MKTLTRIRLGRLQMCLLTVAAVSYTVGWLYADLHTAHAIGCWTLTVLAVTGAIALGNVRCVVDRVVDRVVRQLLAALVPSLHRIIQLEYRQLMVLNEHPDHPGDWGTWDSQRLN